MTAFTHLILVEPLGLLYGSAGRFLSPENLVGRSGRQFPPSAATLSGLFAARHGPDRMERDDNLRSLLLAGPFWADVATPENFHVPLPLTCLVQDGQIVGQRTWDDATATWNSPLGKYDDGGWLPVAEWAEWVEKNVAPKTVRDDPWEFLPHLHPHLKDDERRVDTDRTDSLFLENAVQLHPDTCLVYLSTQAIAPGWYRFGGEGHLAAVSARELPATSPAGKLLRRSLDGRCFATITPGLWGSNRYSYRKPQCGDNGQVRDWWPVETLLCERPDPFRYRLGGAPDRPKRLSRGRYAVPAGSVYLLKADEPIPLPPAPEPLPPGEPLPPWTDWPEDWFPAEAYSFKRWGCGLALPLPRKCLTAAAPAA